MKTNNIAVVGMVLAFAMLLESVRAAPAQAQDRGAQLFEQSCMVCHTIGGGRVVGPDLKGVTERREEDWLISFIRSSQSMIAAGDPIAVGLFAEFGQMPMPDQPYTADQIRQILNHIREQGGGEVVAAPIPEPVELQPDAQKAATQRGRDLFVGRLRFAGGGSACNACHTVDVASVITGGTLARDLTTAYSRLSEAGLRAIIATPAFPAMATAMGRSPTAEETEDLVAFLREAELESEAQPGLRHSLLLLLPALLGAMVLVALAGAIWYGRARRSTNHDVYARQISS